MFLKAVDAFPIVYIKQKRKQLTASSHRSLFREITFTNNRYPTKQEYLLTESHEYVLYQRSNHTCLYWSFTRYIVFISSPILINVLSTTIFIEKIKSVVFNNTGLKMFNIKDLKRKRHKKAQWGSRYQTQSRSVHRD